MVIAVSYTHLYITEIWWLDRHWVTVMCITGRWRWKLDNSRPCVQPFEGPPSPLPPTHTYTRTKAQTSSGDDELIYLKIKRVQNRENNGRTSHVKI